MGLAAHDPAVALVQAPGYDHLNRRLVESGVEKAAVGIGDETVAGGIVGRRGLVGDIELGDLDRQSKTSDFGEKSAQHLGREGWPAGGPQMRLNADRVDR